MPGFLALTIGVSKPIFGPIQITMPCPAGLYGMKMEGV
jgi:hypothetical protein